MKKTNSSNKSSHNFKEMHLKKLPVLSDDINAEIASNIIATTPAPEVAARIKARLMQHIKSNMHQFVFANQGEWKEVYKGVEVKLLRKLGESKSLLIRMAENTSIPAHLHAHDEESFVVEGSVKIQGIMCYVGDYHYALAGSEHQTIESREGCTLLVKSI